MGNASALSAVCQPRLGFAGLGFYRIFQKANGGICPIAEVMNPTQSPDAMPPLALLPGQRVDLLTRERNRLILEYDHARRMIRTGEVALLTIALRNVTNELMKRQLAVRR